MGDIFPLTVNLLCLRLAVVSKGLQFSMMISLKKAKKHQKHMKNQGVPYVPV